MGLPVWEKWTCLIMIISLIIILALTKIYFRPDRDQYVTIEWDNVDVMNNQSFQIRSDYNQTHGV